MHSVFVTMTARADSVDALFAALSAITARTRAETDCLLCEPFRPADGTPCVMILEKWTDRASADAYLTQPHMAALMAQLGGWLAGPPEFVAVEMVDG